MKHETILNDDEEKIVSRLINTGTFGDCYQDKYLIQLCKVIRCEPRSQYGMMMPSIILDNEQYSRAGNHRSILDISRPPNNDWKNAWEIFSYFDYPVTSSALYLGTFNRKLLYPLLDALKIIGADYNTTSVYHVPVTVKIYMHSFKDITDKLGSDVPYLPINKRDMSPSSLRQSMIRRTLKHTVDRFNGPEDLFEVIELNNKI